MSADRRIGFHVPELTDGGPEVDDRNLGHQGGA